MKVGAAAAQLVGFKRHLRAEISAGNGTFLFSERGVTTLRGARIESLAELLDGTRDVATVLRSRPGGMDAEQVADLIRQLAAAGLVTLRGPGELDADERALAYWDACGVPSAPTTATSGVGLVTIGLHGDFAGMTAALRAGGLSVWAQPAHAPVPSTDLSIVLCDDYLNPELAEVDAAHRARGRPWLLARPVGTQVWVGPFFQPGESGCWHCLASRLWGNRRAEACVQATLGRSGPARRPVVTVPALTATATHLVALEVSKWMAGYRSPGQQRVWTLDSVDLYGQRHDFRARPQCAECGDQTLVAAQARRPVALHPSRKVSDTGGGHRSATAEQVLERYRHLISPVTGLVKEITRDRRGPESFNSCHSGPNLATSVTGIRTLRSSLRAQSGGKGVTAVDAEASALCEALERFSATFQGDEQRVRGSLRALGEQAIHPNDCMLFDERQYRERAEWNKAHGSFQYVAEPFDEDRSIDWTPVWSLTQQRHRLLPTAMLYLGASAVSGNRSVSAGVAGVTADSNGNAAGSCLTDAALQGLLELLERDAVALWWYNRTPVPGVDLASFGDPWIVKLRATYAELKREVWVLDVTSDLDVPAMVAVSRRTDDPRSEIVFGCGCHVDPRIAVRRALTELNQMMPTVLDGGLEALDDPDAVWWSRNATVESQPYLRPAARQQWRTPSHYGYRSNDDIKSDVDQVVAKLAARGMDVLVLDQTRPDIGLPVVKMIVPGLRHFWARFGPGRLYDVPVRLGRLSEPTRYEDLNPVPLFL